MREGRPSITAASVAVWRGCGAWLPAGAALCHDPFAHDFVPRHWAPLVQVADAFPAVAGRLLLASPARRLALWIQLRTRAIDDVLLEFLGAGGRQVVVLGAGYDARAARFAAELDGGRVFEVDHPATQGRKRAVLAARGARDDAVRYVAWDFVRDPLDDLPARLAAEGLLVADAVLTIWEGVIMYLHEPTVAATVASVRRLGGPGSRLVFNYTEAAHLRRRRALRRFAALVGEPVHFGWSPAELPEWMARHGFALRWDRDDVELAHRLLPASLAEGTEWMGGHVALAEPTGA